MFGCVGTRAQRLADLVDRQALKVPQHERGSFLIAEFVQCLVDPRLHLIAVRDPVRPRSVNRNRLQDVTFIGLASRAFVLMPLAHSNQIERIVGRDAVEPGGKAGARFVFVQLAIGSQEGLLHHILGVLFISSHTKSQTEDGTAVLLDQ